MKNADTTKMRREFDHALDVLAAIDAGRYLGDPDRPMGAFLGALNGIACGGIKNDDELHVVRAAADYLTAEDPEAPRGSVEDAMAAALDEAVRRAESPLQAALLALVRHQLQGHRIHPLNA